MSISIIILFSIYIGIGLLHAFFIASSLTMVQLFNKQQWNKLILYIMAFILLLFFESYWIKVFEYFKLSLFTQHQDLLNYFTLNNDSNLVDSLKPWGFKLISATWQAGLTVWLSQIFLKKITNNYGK